MKIGRVRGVDLYLRPYILFAFLLALFMRSAQTVLLAYAALAVHEAGHVVAARLMHMRVERIELAPYGGTAHIDAAFELLPARETAIALAGPAASFLLCLLALGFSRIFTMDEAPLDVFVKASFAIGAFNLLPALPLDGGRALRAALAQSRGARSATRFSALCGVCLGGLLLLYAVIEAFRGVFVPSAALAGFCILPSAISAFRGADGLLLRTLTEGVFLDDIPTPVKRMAVRESASAAQVLSRLRPGKYYELLVLDGKGNMKAVISSPQLYQAVVNGADTMIKAALSGGAAKAALQNMAVRRGTPRQ